MPQPLKVVGSNWSVEQEKQAKSAFPFVMRALWIATILLFLTGGAFCGMAFQAYINIDDWYGTIVSAGRDISEANGKLSRSVYILEEEGAGNGLAHIREEAARAKAAELRSSQLNSKQ